MEKSTSLQDRRDIDLCVCMHLLAEHVAGTCVKIVNDKYCQCNYFVPHPQPRINQVEEFKYPDLNEIGKQAHGFGGQAWKRDEGESKIAQVFRLNQVEEFKYPDLNEIGKQAHAIANAHGFHEVENPIPQQLCLIHTEVSEAMECFRDQDMWLHFREHDGKPEGFPSELADIIIRVCDTAESRGINLAEVVRLKMEYNKKRPFKHGRKVI